LFRAYLHSDGTQQVELDAIEISFGQQYTLTFNTDGGSPVDPITQDYDTDLPSIDDPTKTGYIFDNWTPELPSKMPAQNQTHTASWTPITYDIIFDANEGTGTMTNQTLTYDSEETLTPNTFTRTDYSFTGWNTSADGSGTSYSNEEEVENLSTTQDEQITLYAQWTQDQDDNQDDNDTTPPTISNPQGNTLSVRRNQNLTLSPTCEDDIDTSCTPTFSGSIIDPTT